MYLKPLACCLLLPVIMFINVMPVTAQSVISNKNFSLGSYGRVGAGFAPQINGGIGRSLNLNGMGSIGGRMEEADYLELVTAFHFATETNNADSTKINVQARLAFYSTQGQLIGNVSSKSFGGITASLPELYAEASHIRGSAWSAWIGAKFFRGDDVHIADHFYFDDHSSQGFGISYKHTSIAVLFPGAVDTSSSVPPYFYVNIVDGTPRLGLRGRTVLVLEHTLVLPDNRQTIKLLAEFHRLSNGVATDTVTSHSYPADNGWVIGAKHVIQLNTQKHGSYNQLAIRYGTGIANGNDGGNSRTWLTYGAPDLQTQRFTKAYSFSLVDQLLLNLNNHFSINGYGLFTASKGAAASNDKAPDYFGRDIYNRKTEFAVGARSFWYITHHFHLLTELHLAQRKDGMNDMAAMTKFSLVPTFVPTGKRDPWARPHFRFIYSIAHYNRFAADNLYSPFLQQLGKKTWGQYIGVRAEWWIF